jgi:manganese/zinc/iron transport system permease protein
MSLGDVFYFLIFDYTLRTVAIGASVLGIVAGALGAFALLRQQSLLGDAISHSALPGIVIAFLLTRSKAPAVLLVGALIAGWLAALMVNWIVQRTHIKQDSALGLVLSTFFGFGMMLLTFTQRLPDARQAGLDKFLFGQAATLLAEDVWTMAIFGGIAMLLLVLFWKEFKLISFDPNFAGSMGFPVRGLDLLLTLLTVIAIVIGLQAVGVVLMSAMIVAPAAAARQWTDRLGIMVLLSSLFGALSGLVGVIVSSTTSGMSTGPTIVLAATAIVLISFLFAPQRGLIAGLIRRFQQSRQVQIDYILLVLLRLGLSHNNLFYPHSEKVLRTAVPNPASVSRSLHLLAEQGWVKMVEPDEWHLTEAGLKSAQELASERGVG